MSRLIEQLKRHEGLRLKPYRCTAGKLTIGYGRNLDDFGITENEAESMLITNADLVGNELVVKLPVLRELNSAREEALINMAFNIGVSGLLEFKKMIAALENADYDEAAKQMLDSKWARQVGSRSAELARQMQRGEYE